MAKIAVRHQMRECSNTVIEVLVQALPLSIHFYYKKGLLRMHQPLLFQLCLPLHDVRDS